MKTKMCQKCLEIIPETTIHCDCGFVFTSVEAEARRKVCRLCGCSETADNDVTSGQCDVCYRESWKRKNPAIVEKYKSWTPLEHLSYLKDFLRGTRQR